MRTSQRRRVPSPRNAEPAESNRSPAEKGTEADRQWHAEAPAGRQNQEGRHAKRARSTVKQQERRRMLDVHARGCLPRENQKMLAYTQMPIQSHSFILKPPKPSSPALMARVLSFHARAQQRACCHQIPPTGRQSVSPEWRYTIYTGERHLPHARNATLFCLNALYGTRKRRTRRESFFAAENKGQQRVVDSIAQPGRMAQQAFITRIYRPDRQI
jgi:hypothetical protein